MARSQLPYTQTSVDHCDAHGAWFDWGEIGLYMHPKTDDPNRDLTDEELAAAGISGASSHENDGFFGNLKRLFFGD